MERTVPLSSRPWNRHCLHPGTSATTCTRWSRSTCSSRNGCASAAKKSCRSRAITASSTCSGRAFCSSAIRKACCAGSTTCAGIAARACAAPPPAGDPNRVALKGGVASGMIICPYHAWTYDLNGQLLRAPFLAQEPDFRISDVRLYPVLVETWGGFVFVNLTPASAPPFAAGVAGARDRLARYPLAELRIAKTHSLRSERELEDPLRELQRVLSLRARASGVVQRRAGVPRTQAARISTGSAAFRIGKARTRSRSAALRSAARSPASTRTSRCDTRASWSIRTSS